MSHVATNITDGLEVRADLQRLGGTQHLTVTVTSVNGQGVADWALDLNLPNAIVGVYNARCETIGSSRYRITPDRWRRSIPKDGAVAFGILLAA
ncbi:MAG: hypothetical protein AAGF45_03345 [Pseudomonadota bacterium]